MSKHSHKRVPNNHRQAATAAAVFANPLRGRRALVAGAGNIGSILAALLATSVQFIRVVDHDVVEMHNTANQFYGPRDVGKSKVAVTAQRLKQLCPRLQVECCESDLEDLPWEDFADVDLLFGALDSLRARQILSEKAVSLQLPYVDGAVGDPLHVRVQVLWPQQACLECSWGPEHYRQLTTETPCQPVGSSETPRTGVASCAGGAAASVMIAQGMALFGGAPPRESYEINGDLLAGRMITSRRRRNLKCRNPQCRNPHAPQTVRLSKPFVDATVADLLSAVTRAFAGQAVQLEFRRGILAGGLFGSGRFAVPEQLHHVRHLRLAEFGLTPRDRVVVHRLGDSRAAHFCLDSTSKEMPCPT